MAEQILMFRKTVDDLTWAILGDTEAGEDFLNWDNEHPSKITMRIFSKNDQKLDALMSSLNGAVLADFDQQDWFDCLFHTIYWYGIDVTDDWYYESTGNKITDEWITVASTPEGMAPDPFYGNLDPTIDGTWEYFKIIDYNEERSTSTTSNYLEISGVLGLSHTGEGDPEKLALFSMSMNFNDLTKCKFVKNVSYVDVVGGGSLEKSVDRLFAEEWGSVALNGKVTAYDPDSYVENKKYTVIAKGTDPEDDDLKYITYEVTPDYGPNYQNVLKVLAGTPATGTRVLAPLLNSSSSKTGSTATLPSAWTQIAENVWGATNALVGTVAPCNIMLIYVPEYDRFTILSGRKANNNKVKDTRDWDTCTFGAALTDPQNTVVLSTDVYNVIFTGSTLLIFPTKETAFAAADLGFGIDHDVYTRNNVISTTIISDNVMSSAPTPTGGSSTPPGIYTYCFGLAGDYDAYVSDYAPLTDEKTINRLYAEEWDTLAVGDTGTLYDETGYEDKPTDTVARIGTSIDTDGIKFVQFSSDVAYAYIMVGDYDAVIMSFTRHVCATPSGQFTPDSDLGDLWVDDDGITWEVTAKEEADGKVYMEITRDPGDWGGIAKGYELYSKIISGDTDGISTLIPDEIYFAPRTTSIPDSVESYDFYPGVSDPLLKPASGHIIESVNGKYVITRAYTSAELTAMGVSSPTAKGLWAMDGDIPTAELSTTDEYLSFMRRAYMYDTQLHVKIHIYNATLYNGSSQTLSHISPAEYAALFGETSLSAVAIKAIANKHSKTVTELMSDTYKVWEDEDLYIFRINSSYYYSVLKNPPFNDIYINTGTSLTTAFNTLKGVGYYLYPMGISTGVWDQYWYTKDKQWDYAPFKYYITIVSDVGEEFPDLQTAVALNGLSGFLPNTLNTGSTFKAPPYSRKLKVLSKTVSGVTTTLKCQGYADDGFADVTAPVYVQIVFDKVTMPSTSKIGYTMKSIDVSATPF